MSCSIQPPLLSFLGTCIYEAAPSSFYKELCESERTLLESQVAQFGFETWYYRYCCDVIPALKRPFYQKKFQTQQAFYLAKGYHLKKLCSLLAEHDVRFILIKGADLAYRLYPDPSLRQHVDWDIWFHPDDCGCSWISKDPIKCLSSHALKSLSEIGWTIPAQYRDNCDLQIRNADHHFPPHIRNNMILEPHFTLPNFLGVDPHELWDHTTSSSNGRQSVLSPELYLLTLTRHAASKLYFHANLPKLLTDAAILMKKEPVDFHKLRAMSTRWNLPYPGDFLAAFTEFFPKKVIDGFDADPAKTEQIREIFEYQSRIEKPDHIAIALARLSLKKQVANGILSKTLSCDSNKIRRLYCLRKTGAFSAVLWGYVCYFASRARRVLELVWHRDIPKLSEYIQLVDAIESIIGSK